MLAGLSIPEVGKVAAAKAVPLQIAHIPGLHRIVIEAVPRAATTHLPFLHMHDIPVKFQTTGLWLLFVQIYKAQVVA